MKSEEFTSARSHKSQPNDDETDGIHSYMYLLCSNTIGCECKYTCEYKKYYNQIREPFEYIPMIAKISSLVSSYRLNLRSHVYFFLLYT